MRLSNSIKRFAVISALMLFVLIPGLSGCTSLAGLTSAQTPLPPAPRTPGAIVTNDYVCIPLGEAAELQLWIEHAEAACP